MNVVLTLHFASDRLLRALYWIWCATTITHECRSYRLRRCTTTLQFCTLCPMPCCLYSAANTSLCFLWDPWFLVGWKLAPPACPGTTGRHDFDIRSHKPFLETVDLAREYKVPICRFAIKFPSYAHCIRFVVFVHRFRSKMIGSCQKQCKSGQGGLIKVPFWNSDEYFPTVAVQGIGRAICMFILSTMKHSEPTNPGFLPVFWMRSMHIWQRLVCWMSAHQR